MIDRTGLAEFLRRRRELLQPEDVGLPRGQRRRTKGLRREEVAVLCHMSTDYYSRIERERGPQPSEQMIASIAQGLHLSIDERDHLFRLAGHHAPTRGLTSEHISPGLLRILDRLDDTPAEVVTELGETLRQTALGVALTGDTTGYRGPARSIGYRWFTDPDTRRRYAPEDHPFLSRMFAAGLRQVMALRGPDSRAAEYAELLLAESAEFRRVWDDHEVGIRPNDVKHFVHPEVGALELTCQSLLDPDQSHRLLVYTAHPGSESHEKLQLLAVIGAQKLAEAAAFAHGERPEETRPQMP
ncbi:helix-turn-helix transcriptional regulator [Microlunatus sp. GCM10028923]|uniref:helix-turn-helix transcriptional regulator n=1 Tax=Microlunatus sp. GCM10028923 TaxID=3273400 RepID=UPI0036126318